MRYKITTLPLATIFLLAGVCTANAEDKPKPKRILFTNVKVFDGISESLQMNTNSRVEGNLVT